MIETTSPTTLREGWMRYTTGAQRSSASVHSETSGAAAMPAVTQALELPRATAEPFGSRGSTHAHVRILCTTAPSEVSSESHEELQPDHAEHTYCGGLSGATAPAKSAKTEEDAAPAPEGPPPPPTPTRTSAESGRFEPAVTTRDVSDSHPAPRIETLPMRTVGVQSATPKLVPLIVATMRSAMAPLATAVTTGASYAKAAALVCTSAAAPRLLDDSMVVMSAGREEAAGGARMVTDVSEIQALTVAACTWPTATARPMNLLPKLMPLSVMEAPAVAAVLLGTKSVTTGASTVKLHWTSVAMPPRVTVTSAASDVVPSAPFTRLVTHDRAVSEIHCDAMQLY